MTGKNKIKWSLSLILTLSISTMNAQSNQKTNPTLTAQQQGIVTIAALTAVGDLDHLKTQLNIGLTKSQLKQAFTLIETHVGKPQADIANQVLMKMVDN
jgi:4-carboxymuconolactone decarboxylase